MISSIVNNEVLLIVTFLVILLRDALHSIFSVRARWISSKQSYEGTDSRRY